MVYAIGSFGSGTPAQRLEAYDPATNTWSSKQMVPFAADHPNVAATADKLYVLGATGTTMTAMYDPVTNMWTAKRPIPTQRAAAATAAVGTKIYVAGGSSANATVRDFAAYDTVADTWEMLEALPVAERNHAAGAAVGGIFYVIGGRLSGPTGGLQSRVDAYDPVARQWTAKAPMPRARGGVAAGVVNDLIIVVGGEGNDRAVNANGVFPETDAYQPSTNTWRTLTNMLTPRHGMGAAGVGGKLYVPGGATAQGGGTAVAILEAFTP
jgi:N-acetylneuraminic acid mutarotase